jgi:hypothetical protein
MSDSNPAGWAEAFSYAAQASGTTATLALYVELGSAAARVELGLYADAGGTPGARLTGGVIEAPVGGAWNAVAVPPAAVVAGRTYWLALLSPEGAGTVRYRSVPAGGPAVVSAQTTLAALPAAWTAGASYPNSPMSAYAALD